MKKSTKKKISCIGMLLLDPLSPSILMVLGFWGWLVNLLFGLKDLRDIEKHEEMFEQVSPTKFMNKLHNTAEQIEAEKIKNNWK